MMQMNKITAIETLQGLFSDSTNMDYPFTEQFAEAVNEGINALTKQIKLTEYLDYLQERIDSCYVGDSWGVAKVATLEHCKRKVNEIIDKGDEHNGK